MSLDTLTRELSASNALTYLLHSSIGLTPAASAASAIFCPCSSAPVWNRTAQEGQPCIVRYIIDTHFHPSFFCCMASYDVARTSNICPALARHVIDTHSELSSVE